MSPLKSIGFLLLLCIGVIVSSEPLTSSNDQMSSEEFNQISMRISQMSDDELSGFIASVMPQYHRMKRSLGRYFCFV